MFVSRRFIPAAACVLVLVSISTFALAGTAAAQEPVEISSAQELQNISSDLDGHYVLTEDIDASDFGNFKDIGQDRRSPFTGTFDGNGHTISGLNIGEIDNRRQDTLGLFGVIGENGTVRNVGIEDARVVGYQDVGGLAGINRGEISGSYVEAQVGGFAGVGGLVGNNKGEIRRSYSVGEVNATGNSVGGLVGTDTGKITEAYAGAILTVNSSATATGGAVGAGFGNATYVYWDTNVSGTTKSGSGTGLTTQEMTGERARETMEGFDFNSTWRTTGGYPALAWQPEGTDITPPEDRPNNGDSNDGETDDGTGGDTDTDTDGTGNEADGTGATDEAGGGAGMPGFGVLTALAALASGLLIRLGRHERWQE